MDIRNQALDLHHDVGDGRARRAVGELALAAAPVIEKLYATKHESKGWMAVEPEAAMQAVATAQDRVLEVGRAWRRLVQEPSLPEPTRGHVERLAELQINLRDQFERLEHDLRRRFAPVEAV